MLHCISGSVYRHISFFLDSEVCGNDRHTQIHMAQIPSTLPGPTDILSGIVARNEGVKSSMISGCVELVPQPRFGRARF